MTQELLVGKLMALPSSAKAAKYREARNVGVFLFLFQFTVLVWFAPSRALGADTMHAFLDMLTLAGTAYLYQGVGAYQQNFAMRERKWLLFGVWSLAGGGILVGGEALYHLVIHGAGTALPSWWLLAAVFAGAVGNWWMHRILHSVEHSEHDALHMNNVDHVFWDMVLSFSVFASWCSMLLFQTSAVDHYIAIVVGFFVLPYLAWKRWKEKDEHHHGGEHRHDHSHE